MTDNNSTPSGSSFPHRSPGNNNSTNDIRSSFSRGQQSQSDWRGSRSTSRSFEPGNRTNNNQQRLPSFNPGGGSTGSSQMNSGGSRVQQGGGRSFQQPSNNGSPHHSPGSNGRGRH